MDIAYPAQFPTEHVVSLYSNLRAGTVYENRDVVGKDAWIVQGYAFRSVLGEPGQAFSFATLSDEERGHLEALSTELESFKSDTGGDVEALARERPLLRMLLEQALPILLNLLLKQISG